MGLRIWQIDSFTDTPFAGNPAGVTLLPEERSPLWMQLVAREMNLSETAFLVRRPDGFGLRWFTPTIEVELCGHATLAAAHFLWETGELGASEAARFHTPSGLLTATQDGKWIRLDFPARVAVPADPPEGMLRALGGQALGVYGNRMDYLVEYATEEEVRALSPDHGALRRLRARGVIVTAPSNDSAFEFVSRFFAPGSGIDEDPVTGSAHCALGPFWGERLGKTAMVGRQVSARGGVVRVTLEGERVALGGQAVTVFRAELADGV